MGFESKVGMEDGVSAAETKPSVRLSQEIGKPVDFGSLLKHRVLGVTRCFEIGEQIKNLLRLQSIEQARRHG